MAKQPCLICGRRPADPHHLRFAQHRALGRKVSDEFTVPLCRGHHREVHRCGDEAAWWKKAGTQSQCPRPLAGDASAAAMAAITMSTSIRPDPDALFCPATARFRRGWHEAIAKQARWVE